MKKIYLDYAAATPMDKTVHSVMEPYFTDLFYNPAALYLDSKSVAEAIAMARKSVAGWLGARPSEVIFTAGGTEANNLAVHGIMEAYPNANVLVSAIEHDSVMKPAVSYDSREITVDHKGTVDINDMKRKIDDRTILVSVMYANNEIGTIQPLAKVAGVVQRIRKERQATGNTFPLFFHTDACQAANYLSLQTDRLGIDLMTLNGGKIYGPKQSGVLYVGSHVGLRPVILGGGQERGLRAGTENVAGIVGFAAALDKVQTKHQQESKRLGVIQRFFLSQLAERLPQVVVNGSLHSRLVNNMNISIPGQDNERLVMLLDEKGVQCATGSACSALSGEPSHVLRAIGLDDAAARSSLRFTMGAATDEEMIRSTVDILAQIVA